MKKYYIHDGSQEVGPFSVDELLLKGINGDTPIWYDGIQDWTIAGKVQEISSKLYSKAPPPFIKPQPQPNQTVAQPIQQKTKVNAILSIIATLIVATIVFYAVMNVANNPNSIPGIKVEINTPKPVVITSRADNSKSDIKMRATIYATIQNQGGSGNAAVIFHLTQDGNTYDRTKIIPLASNESKDVDVTFDEVRRLGGEIKYNVEAQAQ